MADKITKVKILKAIIDLANKTETEFLVDNVTVTSADIVNYAETTILQLQQKADRAKERAKEKKAEDPLKDRIQNVLTEEPQSIPEIFSQVVTEGEDITPAKVSARLNKLVKEGVAKKEEVKDLDTKRKLVCYFC